MENIATIAFRFAWPDATETSVIVRLNKAGLVNAVTPTGDPAKLPDLELYRSLNTVRAEAHLFASVHRCKLTVEEK